MNEDKNKCSTCERIRQLKEQGEYYKKVCRGKYETVSVCKVALVVEDYYDIEGELEYGGRVSYNTESLKFCPQCGKQLNEDDTIW